MARIVLQKPLLIMLYGFPGSGKTFLARQLSEETGAAHLQADRIRAELFDRPRYDHQEADIITHLTDYMAGEFLNAGVSVIYDGEAMRAVRRKQLRDLARSAKAQFLLIWLQIDADGSFDRTIKRDKRKNDDRYARSHTPESFNEFLTKMQNPQANEEYIVVSGKHTFATQRGTIAKRLFDMGLIDPSKMPLNTVRPSMVNLVPSRLPGRVDPTRRNISVRS